MAEELPDNNRELLLSRYLDGELDESERNRVVTKLRDDAAWRAEFEALQSNERLVGAVIRRYGEDDGFSVKVTERLKARPAPAAKAPFNLPAHRPSRARRIRASAANWPLRIAALAALTVGGVFAWKIHQDRRALHQNETGATTLLDLGKAPQVLTVTEDIRAIDWPDGTRILARKGSTIESVDDRHLKLSGEAMFIIATAERPFTVATPGNQTAQALGTRFDVKTSASGARVRVAEGHVRVQSGATTVDALGGTQVASDLRTQPFDGRELGAAWKTGNAAEEFVAPWPQVGGSAGHTGVSPLMGPQVLVGNREFFCKYPPDVEPPASGAVVGLNNRAYVLAPSGSGKETRLLEVALSGASRGVWKTCAAYYGAVQAGPVITPKGLVITAQPDGTVNAYDPGSGKPAWSHKESSGMCALCAAPDGTVLLSAEAGLAALDGRDGKPLWRCSTPQPVRASAAVTTSGRICAVTEYGKVLVVNEKGRVASTFSWPRNILQPPTAVVAAGEEVWLTSMDGFVARMGLEKGAVVEKYFGWQLKCSPIATGLLGVGALVMRFDQPAAVTAPAEDTVVALAQDGRNEVFAGFRRGVLHLRAATPEAEMAQMKGVDFTTIAEGEIVKHGLAIVPGRLIVTTTRGVQVFE